MCDESCMHGVERGKKQRIFKVLPIVIESMKNLTEREKELIQLRFYKDKKQTEIAKYFGISQVQVSRLEKQIIRKMKANLG